MKILEEYAGPLSNFEVLNFLRSRGAGKDPTRIIASVAPSEYKVYDFLDQTVASVQTRDVVIEVVKECKKYDLAPAEILNIINIRPASAAEIDPIIEDCESRLGDSAEQLIETLAQLLPPLPTEMEAEEEQETDMSKEGTTDEPQKEGAA